jgi:hypothetical protein
VAKILVRVNIWGLKKVLPLTCEDNCMLAKMFHSFLQEVAEVSEIVGFSLAAVERYSVCINSVVMLNN